MKKKETHPSSLERSMKMLGALLITLSAVTPASSVFIAVPGVIAHAGSGAILAFAIAAVICLFSAFVYAELASAYPLAGGEYAIVGRVLGPFAGFVVLGVTTISLVLIIATVALGVTNYLSVLVPNLPKTETGMVLTLLTTMAGILNIRTNAWVTGVFLSIELAALATLSYLGFHHIYQSLPDILAHPVHLAASGALQPTTPAMLGLAVCVAIFAYNGYGNALYLGEETHNAPRKIAATVIWALLITVIAELTPVTAVILGSPNLQTLFASENMLGDFVALRGGEGLKIAISLGIVISIISASIATILMAGRLLYSTGRDRTWHTSINHRLTAIHKKFHSPWIATIAVGGLAMVACLIDFELLLVITGTSIVFIYAILCITALVGRYNGSTKKAVYRMRLYPLPPLLLLMALSYVVYANFLDVEFGRPSLWATLTMILVSAGYYVCVLRRKGNWVLRGPEDQGHF